MNVLHDDFLFLPFICLVKDYKEKPDYGRCVSIVASASLREMIKPGALAIISPTVIGEFSSFSSSFSHFKKNLLFAFSSFHMQFKTMDDVCFPS